MKHIVKEISEPLAIIYNKSLSEGVVPQEWKRANITPLFKKGARSDAGNYRPVSLTSYLEKKTLEAIMKDKIMYHLTTRPNSLINESQHGFRPKKSCLTNMLEFFEYGFRYR